MKRGWEVKTLGEVCETKSGGTPLKSHKDYYEYGTIPWLRSGEVCKKDIKKCELFITKKGLDNSSATMFPKNTVLIAMYGATAGQSGILRFECSTNQAVCGILPNKNFIPEFLYYQFLAGKDVLIKQATGGAQPNISQIKIKNTLIPVPPIAEQKQIVAKLDKCFAVIDKAHENTSKNLTNTKQLFQSQLTQTFTQKDKNWEVKKLQDACSKTSNIKWKELYGQQFEYIDLSSVSRISLSITASTQINSSNAPSRAKKIIKTNDIIFATTRPTLKRIASINDNFNNQICSTGFVVLRAISNIIEHKFIFYFLQTDFFMKEMESTQKGTSYPAVTDNNVKSIKIPIPPLKQQKQIVGKLDALQKQTQSLESNYQNQLKSLEDLKKSLLEKAFSGSL